METSSKRIKYNVNSRSSYKDLKREREERKLQKKKWKEDRLIRAMEKKLKEKKLNEQKQNEKRMNEMKQNEKKLDEQKQNEEKMNEMKQNEEKMNEQKQEETQNNSQVEEQDDQSEEEEEKEKTVAGRDYTVSIALPGSILDNAQSYELRTYLAGQIARAAVVFNIDEIIIFDESGNKVNGVEGDYNGIKKKGHANIQLGRILQYLECPQYLRKCLFPKHHDLQYAGLLNPLDCPHHTRVNEVSLYREGLVLDKPNRTGKGSLVNVGLRKEVEVDKVIPHGMRVTVKLEKGETEDKLKGKVVSYSTPRKEHGIYWGYSVRLANCLSAVFADSPFGEYDVTIGTSERGTSVDDFQMKKFKHALIVFGGVKGLEASLDADDNLEIDDPKYLFPHYLNTCPTQGSRTIRTEEAILITLSALRPRINAAQQ